MNKEEIEKKKAVEIARLANAIKKTTESVVNLFKALERPSIKLGIEIDKFCREIGRQNNHTYAWRNRKYGTM